MPTIKVKILSLQTFLDVSIQYFGVVDHAFAIAFANSKNITDTLISGEVIHIPTGLKTDLKVLQYYNSRGIIPATQINNDDSSYSPVVGIGTMMLENNFIVN